MAVKIHIVVPWFMTLYKPVDGYQPFGGTSSTLKMEAICSSKPVVPTYQTKWCHNPQDYNMNRQYINSLHVK
jgi:hypothetical protein